MLSNDKSIQVYGPTGYLEDEEFLQPLPLPDQSQKVKTNLSVNEVKRLQRGAEQRGILLPTIYNQGVINNN